MQVTPTKKKFGKYSPGDVFEMPDKTAKVFIKVGKLQAAESSLGYQTRMMQAAPAAVEQEVIAVAETTVDPTELSISDESVPEEKSEEAPFGYKADGTPRKRRAPNSD